MTEQPLKRPPYPRDWKRQSIWQKRAEGRDAIPGRIVRYSHERRLEEALKRIRDYQAEVEMLRYALAVERGQIVPGSFSETAEQS